MFKNIFVAILFSMCFISSAMAEPFAMAGQFVIYRPYVIESYYCTSVVSAGISSAGEIEATCYQVYRSPINDDVFYADFDTIYGGWKYTLNYNGIRSVQISCRMLAFGPQYATIACS